MKLSVNVLVILLLGTIGVNGVYAQSPREQLQQMVEQLQKSPGDTALREKIIRLATSIKPAPAIPEEANRAFVKGGVFQTEAKDASGYELAISAYREALRTAAWWGDAYFNLAAALESAGKFDEAIASIKLYMVSMQAGSAEARQAQNRVYAIEAKSEMASRQATAAAQQAQASAVAQAQRFEGNWYRIVMTTRVSNNEPIRQSFRIDRDPNGNWRVSGPMFSSPASRTYDVRLEGVEFKFKDESTSFNIGTAEYGGSLSADGSRMRFTYRSMPPTPAQESVQAQFGVGGRLPNNRFGDEEWLKE